MTVAREMRALIVGAGIGGLSLAHGLLRLGMDVAVFERMPELREVGSGLTLWVNAMRALEKLGVDDGVRARAAVVEVIENRSWRGRHMSTLPIHAVGKKFGADSYSIHRGELQAALASALPDGVVQVGREATALSQDDNRVTLNFKDGSQERGDLLVGADGIYSIVRSQLFGTREPRYSGYTCWRSAAKVEAGLLPPTTYVQLYGPSATFGIFPIGPNYVSWYGTKIAPAGEPAGDGAQRKRDSLATFGDWYGPVVDVLEATEPREIARQDIYDREPLARWTSGRVTLLGDAAHATTPALGQGGCMAIEDAVVLSRELSLGGDVTASMRRYESKRRKRTYGIVAQARRHGAFYHGRIPVLAFVRDLFLRSAPVPIAMREVEKLMGYEA